MENFNGNLTLTHADQLEDFTSTIETETLPALEIIHNSLRSIDDTHGQRVLLQDVINRLRGQCEKN